MSPWDQLVRDVRMGRIAELEARLARLRAAAVQVLGATDRTDAMSRALDALETVVRATPSEGRR